MFRSLILFIIGVCLFTNFSQAQSEDSTLVQFSGAVVNGDSLAPVPFTSIVIKGSNHGTISDFYGFFSLVADQNDTIEFSCVGYKTAQYVIPDSLTSNRYSLIQLMTKDTFLLKETVIYPWPTREQFKQAFLNLDIPEDDYDRAMRNLAQAELNQAEENIPVDGSITYKYNMQQRYSKLYYAGQNPPNNLLNPIAWAQFIKAWQDGEFKRQ